MNIIEAIPTLYPKTGSGKYKAEFEDEKEAHKFAVGIREQLIDIGLNIDNCYDIVQQRNSNVYIDIEEAKLVIQEKYIQLV